MSLTSYRAAPPRDIKTRALLSFISGLVKQLFAKKVIFDVMPDGNER